MKTLLFALLFLTAMSNATADIVRYLMTGTTGAQASTTTAFVDPLASASALIRGAGVTSSVGADTISSSGWSTGAIGLNGLLRVFNYLRCKYFDVIDWIDVSRTAFS